VTALLDQVLTLLLLYGYPVLFSVVLIGTLGAPLPISILAVAAGGLAAEGDLSLGLVFAIILVGAVVGDCLSYGVARWAGEAAVIRHSRWFGLNPGRLAATRRRLSGWTAAGVFLTRWLLTPLSVPANVVAALAGLPAAAFVATSLAGELIWTTLYVGLGFAFGESWPALLDLVNESTGLAAGVALVLIGAAAAVILWRGVRSNTGANGTRANDRSGYSPDAPSPGRPTQLRR
jgi:membrane protein DedA with SNARE-associated domain